MDAAEIIRFIVGAILGSAGLYLSFRIGKWSRFLSEGQWAMCPRLFSKAESRLMYHLTMSSLLGLAFVAFPMKTISFMLLALSVVFHFFGRASGGKELRELYRQFDEEETDDDPV